MTTSLTLAFVWCIAANVTGMFPSKRKHWPQACALIALGLPILAGVFWQNGPWVGLLVLAAACSVLRWPMRFLFRWLRRQVMRERAASP